MIYPSSILCFKNDYHEQTKNPLSLSTKIQVRTIFAESRTVRNKFMTSRLNNLRKQSCISNDETHNSDLTCRVFSRNSKESQPNITWNENFMISKKNSSPLRREVRKIHAEKKNTFLWEYGQKLYRAEQKNMKVRCIWLAFIPTPQTYSEDVLHLLAQEIWQKRN